MQAKTKQWLSKYPNANICLGPQTLTIGAYKRIPREEIRQTDARTSNDLGTILVFRDPVKLFTTRSHTGHERSWCSHTICRRRAHPSCCWCRRSGGAPNNTNAYIEVWPQTVTRRSDECVPCIQFLQSNPIAVCDAPASIILFYADELGAITPHS